MWIIIDKLLDLHLLITKTVSTQPIIECPVLHYKEKQNKFKLIFAIFFIQTTLICSLFFSLVGRSICQSILAFLPHQAGHKRLGKKANIDWQMNLPTNEKKWEQISVVWKKQIRKESYLILKCKFYKYFM